MSIAPETLLALVKFKDDGSSRDALRSDHKQLHVIDTLVRVRGTMEIGADREQPVPAAVPWQKVCTVLMSMLPNVDISHVLGLVLQGNGKLEEAAEELSEVAGVAMGALVNGTKRTVRGAVKVRVQVEEVPEHLGRAAHLDELDPSERAEIRRAQRRSR